MKHADDNKPMRVRFGPSPTGLTHLGSARTALYNYLLAQQTGGQFILRFEDTDQKRYDPEAENDLITGLKWLGLHWDEGPDIGGENGPYRQSERKELYQEVAQQLIENGDAFYCFCSREQLDKDRQEQISQKQSQRYSGRCRNLSAAEVNERLERGDDHVIRFKMPHEGTTTVHDRLRGDIIFENDLLDDYVLVKSDGLAVYHLATMVDDHLMEITHVLRGEEWIPTFPLHARIYRSLGWDEPQWVHLSLFLKPSGKGKMSKRDTELMKKSGESIFIKDMQNMGYLPEAVLNWVALMGWSYDDQTEFFTLDDLIEKFSLNKLSPKNAAIDFKKFDHYNRLHIRNLALTDLAERFRPFIEAEGYQVDKDTLLVLAELLQQRVTTLDEVVEWTRFLFLDEIEQKYEELVKGLDAEKALQVANSLNDILTNAKEFNYEELEQPIRDLADKMELKLGQVFGVLRIAITGQQISPPLIECMDLLGKEKTLKRLNEAIGIIRTSSIVE